MKREIDPIVPVESEEKPPLFSSWRILYAAVAAFLVFQVIAYYIFTKIYS